MVIMKRLYFLATALLVTMVANSCVEENLSDNVQQESGVPVKFDLSSREMLKVAVSDAGAVTWVLHLQNLVTLIWHEEC